MDWNKVQKEAAKKVVAGQANNVRVTTFLAKDAEELCARIEQAYPDLQPDVNAVINAGAGADGKAQKLAVYTRPRNRAEGIPAANVTLYRSGKAVWTGLAPL